MINQKNSPLGKGLKALLPVSFQEEMDLERGLHNESKDRVYFQCPLSFISANPYQPRHDFESESLNQLSASIKEKGVLQPLLVRKVAENQYELIAGERRLRAAKMAGLEKVPVVTKEIAMSDRLEIALIENIQRENLNSIDEAKAYQQLMKEFGLTQDSVAKRLGKERSTIANCLRLLNLPEDIQQDLIENRISAGHARVLLSLENHQEMRMFRDEIVANQLSVREAEALSKTLKNKKPQPIKEKKDQPNLLPDQYCFGLKETIREYLGSKSKIVQKGSGGKIEIEYKTPEDLDRIISLIVN